MAIKCPYCAFTIELKGIRAGHFHPKCPRCGDPFSMVIHPDANMQPTVTATHDHMTDVVADALGIKPPRQPAKKQTASPDKKSPPTHLTQTMPAGDAINSTSPNPSPVKTPASDVGATSIPRASDKDAAPPADNPSSSATSVAKPQPQQNITPPSAESAGKPDNDIPSGTSLGGYEIIQKLGSGGMGAVYLARQVSLDRNVALKTLHPQLAQDPQLVSRFTREAYAAAQLTHHNIVQIHDIGQDKQINFFSMEFVNGTTLASALREAGKLDTETGVSYVLQAARGLKFAHDHGLIHRDIKPENLLLNDQGIVKVADLGLVKRVGSHETENMRQVTAQESGVAVTQINKSMGTPLYMPPEQAMDAARVDHRADIYSLGCTLYHLITGRPPFTGRTAMEVMTKHQHEPVTPPDVVVKDVPATLSPIIVRMLAKQPDARYAGMQDVIASLEGFLGVATSGPYTPKDDQVKILEYAAERYNNSTLARLRPKLILAFYGVMVLLAVLMAYIGSTITWKVNLVGGVIGLGVLTTIIYQFTLGMMRGTYLSKKVRQLIFGAGIIDWLLWLIGLGVFGYVIYSFGLSLPWICAAVLAVMISQGFYWTVDTMAAKDRETYLRQAEHLIKQMRLKGLDENAIRQFVCRFSGRHWEEFFENLFGYPEKLQARQIWGKERGKERPKFAAWREPIINYIEYRIESRKQLKEAKLLAKLEAKALQAKGIEEKLAKKQAGKNAQRLVSSAEIVRRESEKALAATAMPPTEKKSGASVKETAPVLSQTTLAMSMLTGGGDGQDGSQKDLSHATDYVRQSYLRRRYGTPLQILTSPMLRLILSLILLSIYAHWWNTNFGASAIAALNEVKTTHQKDAVDVAGAKTITGGAEVLAVEALRQSDEKQLELPLVPTALTHPIKPNAVLAAGILLLVGSLARGKMLGIAMYLSAGIALVGYQVKLPVIDNNLFIALIAASGVWVFAIIFLRVRPDME